MILNILASHYVESAKAATESVVDRDRFLVLATGFLNDAERIERLNIFTILIKGNLMLLRKEYDQALVAFRGSLQQNPTFIPALIGCASILFKQKDFKGALERYQTVLRLNPDISPDVRVPIGICFAELGMEDEAIAAFNRAIELDAENINAIVLASVMNANKSKTPSLSTMERNALLANGNQQLLQAFKMNVKHSVVANEMAERFFSKSLYHKVLEIVCLSDENCSDTTMIHIL